MTNAECGMQNAKCLGTRGLALVLIALISLAADSPEPVDLIRDANAAFARGDYAVAEALYAKAEERASDPGVVAFNKGNALYLQEKYRDAEAHYRRALGDAAIPPERRRRGLYNLGNSLLKQAGDTDVARLRAAIRCYEACLDETPRDDSGLRADAAYNLELAKLLWAKARAKSSSPPKSINEEEERPELGPPDPKKDQKGKDDEGKGGAEPKKRDPSKAETIEKNGKQDLKKGDTPETKAKPRPDRGTLPVLEDKDKLIPLSPEDTRAHLQMIAERLRRERIELRRQAATPENPRANDW